MGAVDDHIRVGRFRLAERVQNRYVGGAGLLRVFPGTTWAEHVSESYAC